MIAISLWNQHVSSACSDSAWSRNPSRTSNKSCTDDDDESEDDTDDDECDNEDVS